MDDFDVVNLAHVEFELRLSHVEADDWSRSTPCPNWTVRDLVNHVVVAANMYVLLLEGCDSQRADEELASDGLGSDDPLTDFRASVAALEVAMRRPGALEAPCAHPLGVTVGRSLLRGRAGDVAIHTWDLARAIGDNEHLDPRLVEHALAVLVPSAPRFRELGAIAAPTGPIDETVDPQVRLIRLAGRRP